MTIIRRKTSTDMRTWRFVATRLRVFKLFRWGRKVRQNSSGKVQKSSRAMCEASVLSMFRAVCSYRDMQTSRQVDECVL